MHKKILNTLSQFLDDFPGMSIAPYSGTNTKLHGSFRFKANVPGFEDIEDCFKLEILIPDNFPQEIPKVKETGGKIPRGGDFHVNPDDTLCLGSPLRLLKIIYNYPSLNLGFTNKCLIPYLSAVSYKLKNGGEFLFGELAHGKPGILDDYSILFELSQPSQVEQVIQLLGVKKRIANKKPCPCGCGKRLGVCSFRHKLEEFRKMAPAAWFKAHLILF